MIDDTVNMLKEDIEHIKRILGRTEDLLEELEPISKLSKEEKIQFAKDSRINELTDANEHLKSQLEQERKNVPEWIVKDILDGLKNRKILNFHFLKDYKNAYEFATKENEELLPKYFYDDTDNCWKMRQENSRIPDTYYSEPILYSDRKRLNEDEEDDEEFDISAGIEIIDGLG